ncbi:hypothetical protein M5K25_009810 [Dendrobium thyrsiflorum]|uniref:Uncharacterized protein n=1 Tax=Dendrobium thyrsiflorum TaxID=117978 RepID=A0ABD0V760_DENTH
MAELFVDQIMYRIIKSYSNFLEGELGRQTGMKKELERLRENHPKIQAVVFAANQAQISDQNPTLNKWIWQLRDAIDEAVDVLDEFEYTRHKEQLTKKTKETKKRKLTSFLFESARKILKIGERGLKSDPNLMKLEDAVKKLDKVSADVTTFLHLLDSAKQEQKEQEVAFYKTRETGYLPKNDLIGRRKEKELVMEWLGNSSNEHRGTELYRNISLLSIVGHGGMGKTTLLQHVYKDEITMEFDLKMWVCVSNNFNVKKVIADMLEYLKKERPRLDTLVALQGGLEEVVMSKKFLLVLDDIWEEDDEEDQRKWKDVLAPLASGSFGSKILVTTRTDSVALMFAKVIKKEEEIVKLEGLDEDECLQLLYSYAFAGVKNPLDDHKKLRAIAGERVKKLLGSPLAAEVIGGVLKDNLDERHWRTVLESNLFGQNSINSILRRSYIVLPNHLQNCFAFCCMFPQDHTFDKDDLVRMWIALGFIQPSQAMTMEAIGGRYFDVLVKKKLFDKVRGHYKMHDLIHESASNFFAHECGKLLDDEESSVKISETIRHLSVQTTNPDIIKRIGQFKYLHSLILFCKTSSQDVCNALNEIFKTSRSLRLLYIYAPFLEMIPEEIGNLIYLRYLKIDGWKLIMLPRSLSNLYHLRYIIYDGYSGVPTHPEVDDFLPSDINNISNLHYMKLPENYISSKCGIGKLKLLQELNMFDLRDVRGYRIGELENMNDLCKLGINCLENVKDAKEACSAKLCEKRRLTDLTLSWSDTDLRKIDLYENVLDNLQPSKCLRNLSIISYMGARSARWMNNVNPILNLEKIELTDCMEWETLPPFGQLPFLKSLTLSNMAKVKWIESKFNGNDKNRAFPSLEVLQITKLKALEDWFEAGVAAEDGCLFPCLIQLHIYGVPMLRELLDLPPSLKSLSISGCHPELFERYGEDVGSDRHKIAHIPATRQLPLLSQLISVYLTYTARDHFPLEFFLYRALFLLLFNYSALPTSIIGAMAEWFVGPIMGRIINACSDYLKDCSKDYLKDQIRWQTGMEEELERLRENHPKIQAVVGAANQAQLNDDKEDLNKWIWQLRDAIDEAVDVLDELKYMNQENIYEETKKRKITSFIFESPRKIFKIVERVLKMDPNLKRLEKAVKKLDKVSADVTTFLHLLDSAKQEQKEQEVDFYRTRETGYLPKNDLIGRGEEKELVMEWLRNPSNEPQGSDLYRNISLLSIVGHGGMGKTTLLQHVYKDEHTKEFDLKMWVCVSNNFDVKKVIVNMLECLKRKRPRLDTLVALQGGLEEEVMSKKFLLVLDDIWEEEDEEKDKSKWKDVLAPLASGAFGSKILVTTRTDSVALMFAKVIKKVKTVKFKEDECLELLISHAFAGVENPHHHENLIVIAQDIVKKLSSSPWKAKVIGGILNDNLDERHWRTVLESNLLDQNSNNSILRLSYIVLPKHLQNCFAFCCMFPKDHTLDKDDLVRMWIALGFIQPSQGMTLEDMGGRYFDVLVKKTLLDEVGDGYKMQDLIHESASKFFAEECGKLVDVEESSLKIPETLRHLSVQTTNLNILRKIEKFKHLRSLFLSYEDFNQDLCSALIEIFKALRCLRLLYIRTHKLEKISEEIRYLKHLRYLKIVNVLSLDVTRLPRSLGPSGQLPFLKSLTHKPIVNWLKNKFNGNDKYPAFPLLEVLHISGFEALEDWFEAGVAAEDGCLFPCLIQLYIWGVPMLRELPKLPPSLKHLSIRSCHPELFERYREDGGSDRQKIAHIPHIHISTE